MEISTYYAKNWAPGIFLHLRKCQLYPSSYRDPMLWNNPQPSLSQSVYSQSENIIVSVFSIHLESNHFSSLVVLDRHMYFADQCTIISHPDCPVPQLCSPSLMLNPFPTNERFSSQTAGLLSRVRFCNSESPNFNIFCNLGSLGISQINKSCSFWLSDSFLNMSLSSSILVQAARRSQTVSQGYAWESPQLISEFIAYKFLFPTEL